MPRDYQRTCSANTTAGRPCQQVAMRGQDVCRFHGGSAPQALAAAKRRLAEEAAQQALLKERPVWLQNAEPTTNPIEEMANLSGKLREAITTMGSRLEAEPCVCCGFGDVDAVTTHAHRSLLKEYRSILTDMARLNIEERYVRVKEIEATIVLQGIMAGLEAAGLDTNDEERMAVVRGAVLGRVRELEQRQASGQGVTTR